MQTRFDKWQQPRTRGRFADRDPRRRRDRAGLAIATFGVIVLLLCAGFYRMMLGPGPGSTVGGPFMLADSEGHPVSDVTFRGRYMLIFFGYSSCNDICPQALTEISEALDRFDPGAKRIQPVFITLDPKRDTSERLQRYVAAFSPHLIGLTGTTDQLATVERLFHVTVEPNEADLDHTAAIYLLGPDGKFLTTIPAQTNRSALQATLRQFVI